MIRPESMPKNYVVETADEFEGRNLGPLPLMLPILKRMKIEEIVETHCPSDVRQLITNGKVALVLAANRLCSPMPLLHVGAWAKHTGSELMLGADAELLGDDRLAKTLDHLFEHRWAILAEVAMHVAREFDVSLKRVHYDPTSFHFTGEYDNQSPDPSLLPEQTPFRIEHGRHSHGRDIKEAQIGLNVANHNNQPVPFFYHTIDGAMNHHTAVANNLDLMSKYIKPAATLFMTDRGCFSAQNAVRIKKKERCDFISSVTWTQTHARLFDEHQPKMVEASYLSMKEERKRKNQKPEETWETNHIGEVPSTYTNDNKESIRARLIFVKSSARQKVQAKTRQKSIARIRTDLERIQKSVAGGYYDTENDISQAIQKAFGKKSARKYFSYMITALSEQEILELNKPGRKRQVKYRFTFTYDEKAAEQDTRYDGLYVITTSYTKNKYSSDKIFTMFKEQHHVETAHHQWKAPIRLRPIFLHKAKRIESLILVQFMALMAFYLLQRAYRQRSPKPNCRTTAETLIRHFSFVPISIHQRENQNVVSIFKATEIQTDILNTLGHPDLTTQLKQAMGNALAQG